MGLRTEKLTQYLFNILLTIVCVFAFINARSLCPAQSTNFVRSPSQTSTQNNSSSDLQQLLLLDEESRYYLESRARSDPHAQLLLAIAYDKGEGVPRDDRAASAWYMKAASAGDGSALTHLLSFAAAGRQPRDVSIDRFVSDFIRLATAPSISEGSGLFSRRETQNNLGELYLAGRINKIIDCASAATWFRKAAEAGLPQAQFNLANLYRNGRGLPQSLTDARLWYARAAAQGLASAQNEMGVTAPSPEEAMQWYLKAAAQSFAPAMNNIGVLYSQGRGVAKNWVTAVEWYQKAADLGSASAQNNLGYAYVTGRGVTQNDSVAYSWFEKAAWQGFAPAALNLGTMYATGRGVLAEPVQAFAWFRFAQMKGQPVPSTLIDRVKSELDPNSLEKSIELYSSLFEIDD